MLAVGRSIRSLPAENIIGPWASTELSQLQTQNHCHARRWIAESWNPVTMGQGRHRTGPRTSSRTELLVWWSGGLLELRTICCRSGAPPITRLVVRCIRALPPARPSGSDVRPTSSVPASRRARATAPRGVPACDCASGCTAAGSRQQQLRRTHDMHPVQHDDVDGGTGPTSAITGSL